jgi:hypothetical protein
MVIGCGRGIRLSLLSVINATRRLNFFFPFLLYLHGKSLAIGELCAYYAFFV